MKSLIVPILLLALSLLFVLGQADLPCQTVRQKVTACAMFATGRAPKPSQACCAGVKQIAQSVRSANDKRAICRCLKDGVKSFPGLQDQLLGQIPAACRVRVGFPISMNTNCNA
ncbi:hypothetical protein CDL15_Pgr006011 [Punica granatum]|nr:hypothetical protein CDL15_Pgr006011 [Punica granatum]PKI75216.1 hypothetical protein CRG98_004367 [Punica granatum]